MYVADCLSRACINQPVNSTPTPTKSVEHVASINDDDCSQMTELRLVASASTIKLIKRAAADDEKYTALRNQIYKGWPDDARDLPAQLNEYATFADELVVSDGLIFKGHHVVIPVAARPDILERLHSSHIGMNGCIRRAREAVYYPGITADIKRLVGACNVCANYQQQQQREPLMPHPAPSRPWEKLGIDIFNFQIMTI